jgi:hypothetical protein
MKVREVQSWLGGGCRRRAACRGTDRAADHRILRQDRTAEPAARHVQRQQLRSARVALSGNGPRRVRGGGSRRVPTSTDTPRMPSICVMSSRRLARRERLFTRSAESWACPGSPKGSMAVRWSATCSAPGFPLTSPPPCARCKDEAAEAASASFATGPDFPR